jgi:hypothetical protein
MDENKINYSDFVRRNDWSTRRFYDWSRCAPGRVLVIDLLDVGADLQPINAQAVRKDAANRIVMAAASRARAAGLGVLTISRKPWQSVFLRFDQP